MGWQKVKIGDFLKRSKIPINIENGKSYKRVTIRTKHQGVSLRDEENGNKIGTKKQFVLKEGQFVLSKIDARYGAFGIAPAETGGAIITGNFWAYDVDKSVMNIDWLNQYTNSPVFYDLCERASSGITHRKYLNESFFLNHELMIPDIDEQDTHVEFIQSRKELFGNLDYSQSHQLTLLKKLRQQILQDAVQGKLAEQDPDDEPASVLLEKIKEEKQRLISEGKIKKRKPLPPITDEEIPFDIPDSLSWFRLGEVCFIEKGNIGITKAIKGEFPLVVLSKERLQHNDYQFDCKGVIVALISSTGHGHASMKRIHYQEGKFSVGSILCCIYPISENLVNEKFLFHYLDAYKQYFFVNKMKGAANVSLKISSIAETPIPIVPLKLQDKFASLMSICEKLEQSIRQNQKHTQELLQVALKEALEPNATK